MKKRSSWTNRVDGQTISDSAKPKKVRRPLYKEPFTLEKEGELLFFSATAYAEMSATVLLLLIQLKSGKLENWRCAGKGSGASLHYQTPIHSPIKTPGAVSPTKLPVTRLEIVATDRR